MLNDLANILQIANYLENMKQTSNDKIMKELEKQDKEYFSTINQKLEKIIELLTTEIKK